MTLVPKKEINPTSFPEVNAILGLVLANTQAVLGEQFTGMYLFGSLTSGDFNLHSSDIDYVVVTAGELPGELISKLEAMHAEIAASGLAWAQKLEGFYFSPSILRRFEPGQNYPSIGADWDFRMGGQGTEGVIQRFNLREQGIVLAGPPLKDLIDPVTSDQIRQATYDLLIEWWVPMLTDATRLASSEYQAYAVLTMCRMLYTLQTSEIVSKPAAARWAMDHLGPRWADLIQTALAWQRGMEMDDLAAVQELIRYTFKSSQSG